MSLILDALRKLDRERTAGSAGKRDITAELLKAGDSPRRSGLLPLAITLGATASVAAVVTFFVIGGSSAPKGDTPPASPASPVQARQAAPAPPPTMPAIAEKPAAPQVASPAAPVKRTGGAKEEGNPAVATKGQADGKQEVAAKAPRSGESSASRPPVKISGIVWQEEPSERKAMINGKVARVGETVDGMKVLEIHPSHVKLSRDGKSFKAAMFE